MARTSKAAFTAYYRALPCELQALHVFFRTATEYHQARRPAVSATVQERRWSREDLEAEAYARTAPEPVLGRVERILASDRAERIARIRARRQTGQGAVLRLDLNAGGGKVIAFRPRACEASQLAASA
jgi:hypothetical protein